MLTYVCLNYSASLTRQTCCGSWNDFHIQVWISFTVLLVIHRHGIHLVPVFWTQWLEPFAWCFSFSWVFACPLTLKPVFWSRDKYLSTLGELDASDAVSGRCKHSGGDIIITLYNLHQVIFFPPQRHLHSSRLLHQWEIYWRIQMLLSSSWSYSIRATFIFSFSRC